MAKQITISKEKAIELYMALGYQTAKGWNAVRLERKIKSLPDIPVPPDLEENIQARLDRLLSALKKGKSIIVEDIEEAKIDRQLDKEVKDAAEREEVRKEENRKEKNHKQGKEVNEMAKKETKKETKKATKKATKKVAKKGPGVIGSILEFIQNNGPISKEQILARLTKRFPDRAGEAMAKTIQAQLPNRMNKEKGVKIKVDDKGKYFVE